MLLKKIVNQFFSEAWLGFSRVPLLWNVFLKNSKIVWEKKEYQCLYNEIKDYTVVGKKRCFWVWFLAKYTGIMEGCIAEIGVYKGGTARLIAKSCLNKKVHLFDTFSGMPSVKGEIDIHQEGDFSDTSLSLVQKFLSDCNNVEYHPGFFPATGRAVDHLKFCFVYIDVDIYESVRDCLAFFWNKIIPGGIMLFDDYEAKSCPGVKKAIEEFLKDKKEKIIVTDKYQCAIIKK